jgi:hypothetical protein
MYCMMQYSQAEKLASYCIMHYIEGMKPAPPPKAEILQIRLTPAERDGIAQAAALAGISVSSWVRERLRLAAIRDLEGAGLRVPFVDELLLSKHHD